MENNTNITIPNDFQNIVPTHALVTNVLMKDGTQRTITTLFCNGEFNFEYVNKGVREGIFAQDWLPILKLQTNLYVLKNGIPEFVNSFKEDDESMTEYFERTTKMYNR